MQCGRFLAAVSQEEFRERQLRKYSEMGMTKAEIVAHMSEMAKASPGAQCQQEPRREGGEVTVKASIP
eukprot:336495-Amphidinium_carterae.1